MDRKKVDELVARLQDCSPQEQQLLLDILLEETGQQLSFSVRDGEPARYGASSELPQRPQSMVTVTVVIPDELARKARAAGLLGSETVERLIRRALQERLTPPPVDTVSAASGHGQYRQQVFDMGQPSTDLTRALSIAAELEDEQLVGKDSQEK